MGKDTVSASSKSSLITSDQRLVEIDVVRCIVIIALVAYHAFAPYAGAWRLPVGAEACDVYFWIGNFFYNGMLETFTCISGYVFAYQIATRWGGRVQPFGRLVVSKLRRLMIPCLVWGIAYILILNPQNITYDASVIMALVNGVGHLWYLPMLFWCFCAEYFLQKYSNRYIFLALAVLALLPMVGLPLQLHTSFYYLFFFHLGGLLFYHRDRLMVKSHSNLVMVGLILVATLLFLLNVMGSEWLENNEVSGNSLVNKLIDIEFDKIMKFAGGLSILLIYFLLGYRMRDFRFMPVLKVVAKYSFGTYLFQQIILQYLYFKTPLPEHLGIGLPWIGFIIAFTLSLFCSFILRKSRVTRSLV